MRPRRATAWGGAFVAALLLGWLGGCGDRDRITPGDGGVGGADAGPSGMTPPMPPAPAADAVLPDLTPCRAGWREVELAGGTTVCEPFTDPRPACDADQADFPGGGGCERVGSACPAGEWPADLPASGVIYVRAGGGTGGSGTREDPFLRIGAALGAAGGGDVIALGKGAYDEEVVLSGSARIRGACAAQTTLRSSTPRSGYGVVEVTSGTVHISDLTITGPGRQGLRFEGALEATVEGVRIEGTALMGLGVFSGARVTARDLVVRGTATASDGTAGRGVGIEDGGELTLERAVIEDNHSEGIAALGGALSATDVVIRGTRLAGGFGDGLSASFGARVEGAGIVLEDNALLGLYASTGDPEVTLSDLVVRNNGDFGAQIGMRATASLSRASFTENGGTGLLAVDATVHIEDLVSSGNAGRGLLSQDGAQLEVARVLVADNGGTGITVASSSSAPPSVLEVEDGTFRDNEGPAVQIQNSGRGTLSRIHSTGSLGTAFVFRDPGTTVTASDLVVLDPRREPGAEPLEDRARGVEIRVGAEATLERVRIERARQLGIFVEEAAVIARDVVVRQTTGRDDTVPEWGRGIELARSTCTIERALLEHNQGDALSVSGGSATVTDLRATDTTGSGTTRATGKGFVANGAAQVELSRAHFERNREVTMAVFEEGTRLWARDVGVLGTLERACVEDLCPDNPAGIGVGIYLGAEMELERFVVSDSALVGVQLSEGLLTLRSGLVSQNPVGVNLQPEGVDFAALARDVVLVDNGLDIDARHLPVPDPAVPSPDGAP